MGEEGRGGERRGGERGRGDGLHDTSPNMLQREQPIRCGNMRRVLIRTGIGLSEWWDNSHSQAQKSIPRFLITRCIIITMTSPHTIYVRRDLTSWRINKDLRYFPEEFPPISEDDVGTQRIEI